MFAVFSFSKETLLWTVPQTLSYHLITPSSTPHIFQTDKWGNKIVVLNSQQASNFSFQYEPRAIDQQDLVNYQISDYSSLPISSLFFSEDKYINRHHPSVTTFVKQHLPKNTSSILSIIQILYKAVVDYLIYDNPIPGLYTFSDALEKRRVDCGGFSTLLSSYLQAAGIPTRLVVGYVLKKQSVLKMAILKMGINYLTLNDVGMHAWIEALLPDNSWFPLDPSVEWRRIHGKSNRQGGFGYIPADRLVVSFGHNHVFQYKDKTYTFPIIQDPIVL